MKTGALLINAAKSRGSCPVQPAVCIFCTASLSIIWMKYMWVSPPYTTNRSTKIFPMTTSCYVYPVQIISGIVLYSKSQGFRLGHFLVELVILHDEINVHVHTMRLNTLLFVNNLGCKLSLLVQITGFSIFLINLYLLGDPLSVETNVKSYYNVFRPQLHHQDFELQRSLW